MYLFASQTLEHNFASKFQVCLSCVNRGSSSLGDSYYSEYRNRYAGCWQLRGVPERKGTKLSSV